MDYDGTWSLEDKEQPGALHELSLYSELLLPRTPCCKESRPYALHPDQGILGSSYNHHDAPRKNRAKGQSKEHEGVLSRPKGLK